MSQLTVDPEVSTPVDSFRLSNMQQGMLFHHLTERAPGVDIEQIVGCLKERVDPDRMRWAWEQASKRHAALRTSFRWADVEEPLQLIHEAIDLPWLSLDWENEPDCSQEERLKDFLLEDRQRGFDLAKAPLFRVTLIRISAADYRLVWTLHHTLMDGRSFPVVLKDVFATYEQQEREFDGEPPAFSAYIDWLHEQPLAEAETFWRAELKGLKSPTGLPETRTTDEGRGEEKATLSNEVSEALHAFATEHGLTMNTLVQGAWGLLLARHSSQDDVVFGVTRACRHADPIDPEHSVGLFINTLPVRLRTAGDPKLIPWLQDLRAKQVAMREYEHTPLVKIQEWSEIERSRPLFDSIIVFDKQTLDSSLRSEGIASDERRFELFERTSFPLTLYGYDEPELLLKLSYDRASFTPNKALQLLGHLTTLLEGIAADPQRSLSELPILTDAERKILLVERNATAEAFPLGECMHDGFRKYVAAQPDAVAIAFENQQISYADLNARANQMARHLRIAGVGPDTLVGVSMRRSIEMMVALLGVLKAGGAYVPLDPDYPRERISLMIEDAELAIVLTDESCEPALRSCGARLIRVDTDWAEIATQGTEDVESGVTPGNLAYVIYTSGSTGKPKGVMVEHHNVVNFFTGMDASAGGAESGVWLAVTSISFDISVLELFWTLSRGFKIVLHAAEHNEAASSANEKPKASTAAKGMDFSLFYFASNEQGEGPEKYRLLLEGAKFADRNGFQAVWTPERHFHAFGGLYPNPSVASAALAVVTENIALRAGSVVSPLHDPIRIAEEWALVDNLSNGRVGISFASGWHDRDFVFAPDNYSGRKDLMYENIETVRQLWRGEKVKRLSGVGEEIEVSTLPRPVQKELPIWVTAGGSPETFRKAGEVGANLLTHLLGQSLEGLAEKITIYRQARRDAGHEGTGHVSLMLHTFIEKDMEVVRSVVRDPFTAYLKTSADLMRRVAEGLFKDLASEDLTEEDNQAILDHAFERYFETSGLFGTPETCLETVDRLKGIGVDEIACLIDFGIDQQRVFEGLEHLAQLRKASQPKPQADPANVPDNDFSIPSLIERHHVTHMQCTPSMARMLLQEERSANALRGLKKFLVGGEALPQPLAEELTRTVSGEVHNMYGPTETTIWSTTERVGLGKVSIGRPISNTSVYILDAALRPVPEGVPGELFIGGEGVVRGYWHRDELTKERFVPSPFEGSMGDRLYRTGDLVVYLPDGRIDFLGRLDFQVKIRGHRIELGEIEDVLGGHQSISQAVVTARRDSTENLSLVAYWLPANRNLSTSQQQLRDYLKERIPEHMIPGVFVRMDEFPLTPNGKVDRKALPEPAVAKRELEKPYVPPRDELETKIATLWAKALKIERIGRDDRFNDLGAHSLMLVQVAGKLTKELGRQVSVVELFRYPTVSALAEYLGRDSGDPADVRVSKRDTSKLARRGARRREKRMNTSGRGDSKEQS